MKKFKLTHPSITSKIQLLENNPAYFRFDVTTNVENMLRSEMYNKLFIELLATTEVTGISIQVKNDKFFIRPTFFSGFENFAAPNSGMIGKEILHVDFDHKKLWSMDLLNRLDLISPTQPHALKSALAIALEMIKGKSNLAMLSGPMFNKDPKILKKNFEAFVVGTYKAQDQWTVFNTLPFQGLFDSICELHSGKDAGYPGQILLDEFYFPAMESEQVQNLLQMQGWEHSNGACQEYEKALEVMMKVIPFDPYENDLYETIIVEKKEEQIV